jgi:hypothetical protein
VQPPVPDGADVFAEIQWAPQPAKVQNTGTPGAPLYAWAGASTLGLSVPDKCRDDAINYVCARAHMKHSQAASDQSKASMFANAFLQSLNAQVQTATGNNPNLKRLPFAPANLGTAS